MDSTIGAGSRLILTLSSIPLEGLKPQTEDMMRIARDLAQSDTYVEGAGEPWYMRGFMEEGKGFNTISSNLLFRCMSLLEELGNRNAVEIVKNAYNRGAPNLRGSAASSLPQKEGFGGVLKRMHNAEGLRGMIELYLENPEDLDRWSVLIDITEYALRAPELFDQIPETKEALLNFLRTRVPKPLPWWMHGRYSNNIKYSFGNAFLIYYALNRPELEELISKRTKHFWQKLYYPVESMKLALKEATYIEDHPQTSSWEGDSPSQTIPVSDLIASVLAVDQAYSKTKGFALSVHHDANISPFRQLGQLGLSAHIYGQGSLSAYLLSNVAATTSPLLPEHHETEQTPIDTKTAVMTVMRDGLGLEEVVEDINQLDTFRSPSLPGSFQLGADLLTYTPHDPSQEGFSLPNLNVLAQFASSGGSPLLSLAAI